MNRPATILVIDEDQTSLYLTKELLQFDRHIVHMASSVDDAMTLFSTHSDHIQVVICDASALRTKGVHTVCEIREKKPGITVILTASALDLRSLGSAVEQCTVEILLKPYSGKMLMEFVRAARV
jgi:DNA-binding NtrC family response regulator